ncbi:hypothetical protein FHG87_022905 [Trinorchestia longiramus]|nr:hypothetical protein FHG87_022905 [Trinorchestia longiramus]
MTSRTQRVVIHDQASDSTLVTSGVPQLRPAPLHHLHQMFSTRGEFTPRPRNSPNSATKRLSRRLRGRLIETFKHLNGLTDVTLEGLFERDGNVRTRNNSQKLILRNFQTSQAMNFLSVKIASTWIQLPESIVSAGTVNTFKNPLDKY